MGDIPQATLVDVSLVFVFSNLMFQSFQPNLQEDTAKPYDSKPCSYVVKSPKSGCWKFSAEKVIFKSITYPAKL